MVLGKPIKITAPQILVFGKLLTVIACRAVYCGSFIYVLSSFLPHILEKQPCSVKNVGRNKTNSAIPQQAMPGFRYIKLIIIKPETKNNFLKVA